MQRAKSILNRKAGKVGKKARRLEPFPFFPAFLFKTVWIE